MSKRVENYPEYWILPYYDTDDGIQVGKIFEIPTLSAAKKYADKLNKQFVGFVVFRRTIYQGYIDAVILGRYGKS